MRALSRALLAIAAIAAMTACSESDRSDMSSDARDAAHSASTEATKVANDADMKRTEAQHPLLAMPDVAEDPARRFLTQHLQVEAVPVVEATSSAPQFGNPFRRQTHSFIRLTRLGRDTPDQTPGMAPGS